MPKVTERWQARAERVIAGGCLTFSKSARYYVDAQPSHVVSGLKNHLIGVGNELIFDTVSGLGANLEECANSYSLPSTAEVEFAEALLRRIPYERVKIVKTGTEACMACARFIRAGTGKEGILSLGYHGWSQEFIGAEDPGIGCTETDLMKCKDHDQVIEALEGSEDIAGVFIEPVLLDPNVKEKLRQIRNLCNVKHVLLAFDEVITGWRWPQYTVAQTYGVMPDLIVLGKAIGGGYPLGCVLGPASIMDIAGVFVSGTFAGEQTALERGRQIVDRISATELQAFWDRANDFQKRFNFACDGVLHAEGYGTRMVIRDSADGEMVARYMQEMYRKHSILIGPVMFPKIAWGAQEYSLLLEATREIVPTLAKVHLEGQKPRPVFKRN